nr:hypothetical protein [Myxococcus sp. RHSTA-1-4]
MAREKLTPVALEVTPASQEWRASDESTPLPAEATAGPIPTPPEPGTIAAAPPEAAPPSDALPARARRKPSETRLRVVKALRGEHATPEARRGAVLAELAATGGSSEPWTEDARAALDTWRTRVEEEVLPVRAEPARCFAAGCVARVTFPDAASFEASFQRTAALRLGTAGAHLQLPPERLPSGEVVTSWVVLRPDAP